MSYLEFLRRLLTLYFSTVNKGFSHAMGLVIRVLTGWVFTEVGGRGVKDTSFFSIQSQFRTTDSVDGDAARIR